ncbi:MAG: YdjY domain-containing protein [Planctomycetota bacterium]
MRRLAFIAALAVAAAAVAGCKSSGMRAEPVESVAAAAAAPVAPPTPPALVPPTAGATDSADSAPAAPSAPEPKWIELTPLIRADRASRTVELRATAVLEVGFLEQYVCLVGTREHEALFAFEGKASEVHAALLLVGIEAGEPGRWREVTRDDGSLAVEGVAPRGGEIAIEVLIEGRDPLPLEHFVRASPVVPALDGARPPSRFVFAGSRIYRNPRTGAERYVADGSGSLVGLVTFGDETIAAVEVIPDQASAATPLWEVFSERMPKPGTRVTLRLRGAASDTPR